MHGEQATAEISVAAGVWIAFGLTVALVVAHLLAPRLRTLPGVPERVTASFAGGISVTYVFLHLLPELSAGNEAIGELLQDVVEPTPLLELAIFAVALAGFAVLYLLEHLARRSGDEGVAVFRLHLGTFFLYNALITYTMPLRARTGVAFAALFTVAMALHFVLTDRGLEEHYPRRFSHRGRFVLAAGLLAGWVAGALAAPTSTVAVALLTAALAGSILLNVFKEELPGAGRSSIGWFLAGVVVYGGLLAVVTALSG